MLFADLTYIINELSYDHYKASSKNIYRVKNFLNPQDKTVNLRLSTIAPPFVFITYKMILKKSKKFSHIAWLMARHHLNTMRNYLMKTIPFLLTKQQLDLFDVGLLKAILQKALNEPFSVMLTEDIAKKYFGNDEPLNKVIRMNNQFDLKVTGVYKSFPSNSHMHPELLISLPTL